MHEEAEARRVANLFTITKHHREIWSLIIDRPALVERVLSCDPELNVHPITESERRFVSFLVLHLSASFEARKRRMYVAEHGLRKDVGEFFKLPIPRAVWRDLSAYQNADFVSFVEAAINGI